MNLSELILSTVPEEQRSKPSGVISDQLLDSLRQVESSGGINVGPNPKSGAVGPYQHIPGTVKMLSTRYGKYDPYDEKQSRERTKQYLESLVDYNKGDVRAALAQYGGHITKDPTGYVNQVMGGVEDQSGDLSRLILQAASETPEAEAKPQTSAPRPSKVADIGRAIMRGGIFQPEVIKEAATAIPNAVREKLFGQAPEEQQATEPFIKTLGKSAAGFIDTAAGVVPAVAGGLTYAGARALGQTPEQASEYQQKVISATDKPLGKAFGITEESAYKNEATTRLMNFIGKNMDKGADWISQKTGMPKQDVLSIMESGSFAVPSVAGKTAGFVKRKAGPTIAEWQKEMGAAPGMETQFKAAKGEAPFASVGAAGATPEATVKSYIDMLPPQMAEQLRNVPAREINLDALKRHVEATSLPVEVPLTRGQATQHGAYISEEMNFRGKNPEYAARFNQQNQALVDNLQAIRDIAAPDVYATRPIESGEALIKAYKDIDAVRTANIDDLYGKLRDAAGGDFPIDAQAFVKNADSLLKKELKTEFVPPSIQKQLEAFRNGEPMSFEQFEAMRTNLAAEMRKAERSGDGNAKAAASVIRQALEDLPLSGGAQQLKPLADAARAAAKERFDALKADTAMNAAVNDVVKADDFINKFVVRGKKSDIENMVKNLGEGSQAHQTMSSGVVNWLTGKAGITEGRGNFTQAGYNKALATLNEKLGLLVNPEAAQHLRTLGNVSHYTQYQPKGSYVNNSNTLTAAISNKVAGAAETALNVVGGGKVGLPIGSMIRGAAQRAKQGKEIERTLRPAAGTKLKDIGRM